jgi:hypothetical protein
VIKLLTPSEDYTDEYNAWLASLPDRIFPLVYLVKRYVPAESLGRWRELFTVDSINGRAGHELKAFSGHIERRPKLSSQGGRRCLHRDGRERGVDARYGALSTSQRRAWP